MRLETLTGTVEVDETYVGGRPRYKGVSKRGRGTTKAPVLGMVQREGNVRFQTMGRLTSDRLNEVMSENADLSCRIISDELYAYRAVGTGFKGGHEFMNHGKGAYARVESRQDGGREAARIPGVGG